ncbi:MAG: YhdT family protein [Clostridia bacterium]|nr:YhdT family protein [Clostridia bacterium]
MNKMSKEQKHQQCLKEIKATVIVTLICCAWHIITAFALNGSGLYFLGMPAWFSVSVFGTIVLALLGVWYLMKKVFVDFDYDDEELSEEKEVA